MKNFLNYDFFEVEKLRKGFENSVKMTTAQINLAYLIKVKGQGYNHLVGVSGLLALVGADRAAKMVQRANKCQGDVCRCQVYGQGLQVSFYVH